MSGGATSLVDSGVCTTNLSHYRALLHILAYACQKQHSPMKVVQDALVGGVVHAVRDTQQRGAGDVGGDDNDSVILLPAARCIAALAPLIATGYFVPSLSVMVEGGHIGRYNMICEGSLRDVMTVIVLLFPDCFADGPARRHLQVVEQGASGKIDNILMLHDDNRNKTPETQRHRAYDVNEEEKGTHPSGLAVCVRGEGEVERGERASRLVSPWSMATSLISQSYSPLCGDAVRDDCHIVNETTLRPLADVHVVRAHESRAKVAVLLLAALNSAMHDAQYKLLQCRRTTAKARGAPGIAHGGTEEAIAHLMTIQLQQAKMMLLCCMYATETVYRPPSRWLPREGALSSSTVATNSIVDDPFGRKPDAWAVRPRHVLAALPGADIFAKPVEQWDLSTLEDCNAWYDTMLKHLSVAYSAQDGARLPQLEMLLRQVKDDAQLDARSTGSPLAIQLHRPHDGQPMTELRVVKPQNASLALPVLPVQQGELRLLMPDTSHGLLLNTTHSPLMTFLLQASQRKFAETQVHAEFTHGVLSTPWHKLDVTQKRIVTAFMGQHDNVDRMLNKNPLLLARLVAWCREGATHAQSDKEDGKSDVSHEVVCHVLHDIPFDAIVGQFMRELIVQGAITKELFCTWLDGWCEQAMRGDDDAEATPVGKMIVLLVQFALMHCQWQLAPDLQRKFSTVRTRASAATCKVKL